MGYKIEYDRGNGKYEVKEEHPWRFLMMFAGVFALFLMLSAHFQPEWVSALRSMLIPGEDAITVQAFQTMTNDLRSGATIADAVEGFCRVVIHGK